nr:S-adenosylmethionine mitochondrial carrier protein-like [Megalopta genalis]XP_033339100.1 S-adenosylmethionine mitochondrial carrier protein-like [Megalopta genalis]XP_033339101.1 S-adenosylmethionine mitochondrial carrier protein-like [Megalopta genalis]XP_033339102.1 S-adenosylmethionine mitochondrial carrier protein-like [Megalopta genalis]XP_033339103.1 S-adenosylmethionine mitochondrial carrier protein-like [Megalopta genalis]XP_033339104.1 S-adenosylmethionine mitochondrial carrier pr
MTTSKEQSHTLNTKSIFVTSLIAGGLAGTSVDVALYPLDTLKTRLQAKHGFKKAGGFSGLYKGILPVIIGSAPTASLFFVTYEAIKNIAQCKVPEKYHSLVHMSAASLSEMVACVIRVPIEVVKQRKQALVLNKGDLNLRLLYRGYWSTVFRDMPFSLIQFPLWEFFKKVYSSDRGRDIFPVESAICGAIAGGISAAITTPLDVIKTRIMLAHKSTNSSDLKMLYVLQDVYKEKGLNGLYAGIGPRVMWITLGGFIFFGTYEEVKSFVTKYISHLHIFYRESTI